MTMSSKPVPARRPKGRSPSYPAIDLERALFRVQELWEKEKQYPTPVETIADTWGYRSINGPASLSIAALKKFGLLNDEGSREERKAAVSDLALRILNHPDPTMRKEAIREAALKPAIHAELWAKYGADLPSTGALRWELTRSMGFTETGADEFIPEYRKTVAFAGLDELTEDSAPAPFVEEIDDLAPAPTSARALPVEVARATSDAGIRTIDIPLPGGASVGVSASFPLTEKEWKQLLAVLEVMKPGLVEEDDFF